MNMYFSMKPENYFYNVNRYEIVYDKLKSQCSDYNIDMHFYLPPAKIYHNITLI